jgi:hypothetical protein
LNPYKVLKRTAAVTATGAGFNFKVSGGTRLKDYFLLKPGRTITFIALTGFFIDKETAQAY